MPVSLSAVVVRVAVTIAVRSSAPRRGERLRAPESTREVSMRAVVSVNVNVTTVAMASSVSGGAIHAAKLLTS
jgi:hypothetical protein